MRIEVIQSYQNAKILILQYIFVAIIYLYALPLLEQYFIWLLVDLVKANDQDKWNANYLDAAYMTPEDFSNLGKMDIIKEAKSLIFFFKFDSWDDRTFINDTVTHDYDF